MYELDCDENVPDGVIKWNSSYLWKYKLNANIKHLSQKLIEIDAGTGGIGSSVFYILFKN